MPRGGGACRALFPRISRQPTLQGLGRQDMSSSTTSLISRRLAPRRARLPPIIGERAEDEAVVSRVAITLPSSGWHTAVVSGSCSRVEADTRLTADALGRASPPVAGRMTWWIVQSGPECTGGARWAVRAVSRRPPCEHNRRIGRKRWRGAIRHMGLAGKR